MQRQAHTDDPEWHVSLWKSWELPATVWGKGKAFDATPSHCHLPILFLIALYLSRRVYSTVEVLSISCGMKSTGKLGIKNRFWGPMSKLSCWCWITGIFKAPQVTRMCSQGWKAVLLKLTWSVISLLLEVQGCTDVPTKLPIIKNKAGSGHCAKANFHVHKLFIGTQLKANINCFTYDLWRG